MLVARVRVIAARVADAGEHASAMKDKVTSESLIDRDSADSADILFYREISSPGFSNVGGRRRFLQADGRFEMRTDASSRRGRGFYEVRYGGTLYGIPGILCHYYWHYRSNLAGIN